MVRFIDWNSAIHSGHVRASLFYRYTQLYISNIHFVRSTGRDEMVTIRPEVNTGSISALFCLQGGLKIDGTFHPDIACFSSSGRSQSRRFPPLLNRGDQTMPSCFIPDFVLFNRFKCVFVVEINNYPDISKNFPIVHSSSSIESRTDTISFSFSTIRRWQACCSCIPANCSRQMLLLSPFYSLIHSLYLKSQIIFRLALGTLRSGKEPAF